MSSVPKKQVVLITGCSTGVGLALSVQLAKAGHKVYATMRDVAKATDLKAAADAAQVQVEVLPLDVTDQKSVDECVAKIYAAEGKIDTLVNNAGVALFRPTETASMEEIQQCFDSNFFGAVRMAKAVLPRMRTDRSGRIINISSVGGLIGQPLNDIYCAAKFAMDGWTESMAATLSDYNVFAVVVNPGGIQSAFVQNAFKVLAAGGGAKGEEYKQTMGMYMKNRADREARGQSNNPVDRVMQTSDEVAAVIKEAVEAEKPHFRYVTSEWAKAFVSHKIVDDEHGDKLIAKTRREILGVE